MTYRSAAALCAATSFGLLADNAAAQSLEHVKRGGWIVSGQSDGRGPCSIEQASTDSAFRYTTNGRFHLAGGDIGEIDTRRPATLVVTIDGQAETVRAAGSLRHGVFGYSFTLRRTPPFMLGFDIALVRGDEVAFRYAVRDAGPAYDELLDCASNPFWPEPF